MKQTFSFFSKRNALWCFLLTGFVFLMGMNSTNAQATSSVGGLENPEIAIAQSFNVIAYPFGTFDRDEVIVVLEGIISQLQPLIPHNPSLRLKFKYVGAVLSDAKNYWIATEISLLTNLKSLSQSTKLLGQNQNQIVGGGPSVQYTNLYNEIVSELQ